MSKLRPELLSCSGEPSLDYRDTYYRIAQSVERERELCVGKLLDGPRVCALGSYFERGTERKIPISARAIDEIAAYNDSLAAETPPERWRKMRSWLRFKVARMRKGLE